MAPALAAGCTVVVKGPPDTPWVTQSFARIAAETDLPPGVLNVISSSAVEVGEVLTTDPRVDMVSFTGSTAVGRRIMAAASDTVKKVFLELGGKSAYIVLDDADLGLAAMVASFTICSHAGQGCAITSRLLVPETKADELIEQVKAMLEGMAVGDPNDPGTMMGPLINARQWDKVDAHVKQAVAEGARLVTGGHRPENLPDGYFYAPTLLADVDPDATIAQEETFGPVLSVLTFKDDDDAIAIANNSLFGLSGTVNTTDRERGLRVARGVARRHHQPQRRHVVRPGRSVRRLQAVGHRPGDGRPRPDGVPRDQDHRRAGLIRVAVASAPGRTPGAVARQGTASGSRDGRRRGGGTRQPVGS